MRGKPFRAAYIRRRRLWLRNEFILRHLRRKVDRITMLNYVGAAIAAIGTLWSFVELQQSRSHAKVASSDSAVEPNSDVTSPKES